MGIKELCVCLALVLAVVESLPRHHNIQKRSMRLCGRMLVDALATVCQNEYYDPNHMHMRKRNYAYTSSDTYPGSWEQGLTDFEGFVDPQTALDFLSMPRNARGIADECCKKSCSFNQLLSYCGPSSRSTN